MLYEVITYTIEAASMEQMADQFAGDSSIHIPEVYRSHSTQRVLSMEYIT